MQLEFAFEYSAKLAPPVPISAQRIFYEVLGGQVKGPDIEAEVLSGGGDWGLIGDDGFIRLDVRGQVKTDDGAFVYVTYPGVLELNEAVQQAIASGGETGFDDQYFRITPRFETGDERYRWLTQTAFVGRGRLIAGPGVAYEVYRVA